MNQACFSLTYQEEIQILIQLRSVTKKLKVAFREGQAVEFLKYPLDPLISIFILKKGLFQRIKQLERWARDNTKLLIQKHLIQAFCLQLLVLQLRIMRITAKFRRQQTPSNNNNGCPLNLFLKLDSSNNFRWLRCHLSRKSSFKRSNYSSNSSLTKTCLQYNTWWCQAMDILRRWSHSHSQKLRLTHCSNRNWRFRNSKL